MKQEKSEEMKQEKSEEMKMFSVFLKHASFHFIYKQINNLRL